MSAPLTPPDCDLRGLPFMPLHGDRLIDSDLFFETTGDEFKAALALWWASWKQIPAASLPDNPRVLAGLARVADPKRWAKVSAKALHGWIKCDDGRLYHPVVAEFALEAWDDRQEHRAGREADNERKRVEREERKRLFAELKAVGVHLAWNTTLSILREKHAATCPPTRLDLSAGQVADSPAPVTAIEGTVEGTGTKREKDKPSLSGAGEPSRERRGTEVSLPEGFPDAEAIADAERWISEAAVVLSADAHAKRFANHARTKDRRERNWPAAWRAWIDIEIERAPAAPATSPPATLPAWGGPADVFDAARRHKGDDWAVFHLSKCRWDAESRTLTAPKVSAMMLRQEAEISLKAIGVRIVADEERAA